MLKNYKQNLSIWISAKKSKINKIKTSGVVTFQDSLKITLFIGQLFSLFPVAGLTSKDAKKVKFTLISFKCMYSLFSVLAQIFITIMCIYKIVNTETTLNGTTPLVFYGIICISTITFIRASKRWPELVQHIANIEELDPSFDHKLKKKCNIVCFLVLSLALMEHIFSIRAAESSPQACYPNASNHESFVRHFYPWVFNYLPYSIVLGIISQFIHFQSTFIWNFTDLFVISISLYLTSRLDLVNNKLMDVRGKHLPEIFWRTTRESYCRATKLVRKVDEVISGIVFISFANNLFFVCVQLFNTLNGGAEATGECENRSDQIVPSVGNESVTYLVFSLGFLISRSIAVSLIASQVNMASTVPASVLYEVPSAVYCIEVQRFLDQVNSDDIALTGLQFFSVTRGLLLSVAGTIVTYELVMVQFNKPSASDSLAEMIVNNNMTTIEPMYN